MKLRNKKTGEHGEYQVVSAGYLIRVRNCDTNESYQYGCIAGLNEDWEDYKPAEPLIKDEKNRKLVRAWAKLYDYEPIRTYKGGEYISLFKDDVKGYSSSVGIDLPRKAFREVENDHYYTITDLCGDES